MQPPLRSNRQSREQSRSASEAQPARSSAITAPLTNANKLARKVLPISVFLDRFWKVRPVDQVSANGILVPASPAISGTSATWRSWHLVRYLPLWSKCEELTLSKTSPFAPSKADLGPTCELMSTRPRLTASQIPRASIHVSRPAASKTWMAGTSPAMTSGERVIPSRRSVLLQRALPPAPSCPRLSRASTPSFLQSG